VVKDAADSGKHILCEKPLYLTLEEARGMIDTCRANQVKLVYGEPLCYLPKYVRAKQLADEGALGEVFLIKHGEEHPGPHSAWFWDPDQSGGGVLLDMACHSIEFARWILGRPQVKSVTATVKTLLHKDKTRCDDHSICVIEFETGALAVLENSWAKLGGLDDKCEIYGSRGNTFADVVRGNSLLTYSQPGYGYAMEKAESTQGWSFTIFDELWMFGYPQQMQHFVNVVKGLEEPVETGEDGMEVLRIICAAYQSAGQGRRIEWPYEPPNVARPIDLWLAATG
jgi:predicted dehydrogenase